MGLRWIFFDVGGVLVNDEKTSGYYVSTIQRLLATFDIKVSFEAVERAQLEAAQSFGSVTRAILMALTPDEGIRDRIHSELWGHVQNQDDPYPDARAVLSQLSRRFKLGVIANQLPHSRDRLKRFGFSEYLSVYALSDELRISKPDEAIFTYALRAANCRPEEAMMVGDRIDNDIIPAKRLGMRTVRVLRGLFRSQRPRDEQEIPDAVIISLAELPALELLR